MTVAAAALDPRAQNAPRSSVTRLSVRAVRVAFVRLYEEGLRLYAECAKRLDAADLRITQLADALAKQAKERGARD